MNNLVIPEKNIEVNYPSSWDEIQPKHVRRIGDIMYQCYTGQIDYDLARKMAVDVFLNRVNGEKQPIINDKTWEYWASEVLLAESVNFLFSKVKGRGDTENVCINPKFCTQLVPYVKSGLTYYVGPQDLGADLTIYEFKEASWRVTKYAETREDIYLDEIFAILYKRGGIIRNRKKRLSGFSEKEFGRSLKKARKVPREIKFMIFLYFIGVMNWVREESIEIDGTEINFGCLFAKNDGSDEGDGDSSGMSGLLFTMAESGVFGNMEQTRGVNIWDFFMRLYQIHHQIKSMKRQMKN